MKSHKDFQEAVALMARSAGKKCGAAAIDWLYVTINAEERMITTYSAYIEDYGYTVACSSPEAALAKLQDKIDGKGVEVQL